MSSVFSISVNGIFISYVIENRNFLVETLLSTEKSLATNSESLNAHVLPFILGTFLCLKIKLGFFEVFA